jgi:NitT/TauT family transport system permease protein
MTALLIHTGASLVRVVAALLVSLVLAVPAGMAAGARPRVDRLVSPLAYLLYPIPKIAFLPAFIVLLGLGEASKLALLVTILVFPLYLAARDGVRDIPADLVLSAQTLGLKGWARARHVTIPAVLPRLFSALRLGVGIALSVLFFAENFSTEWGLGSLVMNQWAVMRYGDMAWGIAALSLLGLALFGAVDLAERRLCPWLKTVRSP